MNRTRRVVSLLPILSVATLLGMKFKTLERAARDGRLRVRAAVRKVGGRSRPLVSVRDFARYAKEMIARIDSGDASLGTTTDANRKRMRACLVRALKRLPDETVELGRVVGSAK